MCLANPFNFLHTGPNSLTFAQTESRARQARQGHYLKATNKTKPYKVQNLVSVMQPVFP